MIFFNKIGQFDFSQGDNQILPEGEHDVTISDVKITDTFNGGKLLNLKVSNDKGIGYLRFNIENPNEKAIEISAKEFDRLLIQIPAETRNTFLKQLDFNILDGKSITIFVKHKDFNEKKVADCKVSYRKALEKFEESRYGSSKSALDGSDRFF